jgi:hypothetical protein
VSEGLFLPGLHGLREVFEGEHRDPFDIRMEEEETSVKAVPRLRELKGG